MEVENLKEILAYTSEEKRLIKGYNLPEEGFIPLIFSLRNGGDWAYATEVIRTISILDKTTVYDDERRIGYTREEIYLIVNPKLLESEGIVYRLEKCGEEDIRLLVQRPYRVTVGGERIIKATVYPLKKEISVAELKERQLSFSGSSAYAVSHEIEHLEKREISGEGLWTFRFSVQGSV